MRTELIEVENLKPGDYILYCQERFLIQSVEPNSKNKQFLFIYTTSNTKIELPKEHFIKKIIEG